mgnify:CR=1 FL=1
MTDLGDGWTLADPEVEAEEAARARRKIDALLNADLDTLAQYQVEDEIGKRAKETGIIGVKHDPSHVYRQRDGRLQAGVNWILTPDRIEEIRQGYICLNCQEPLHHLGAFPEECPVCGFRVREQQTAELAKDMLEDEYMGGESDSETEARWAWERSENRWKRAGGKGSLVPPGLNI